MIGMHLLVGARTLEAHAPNGKEEFFPSWQECSQLPQHAALAIVSPRRLWQ